MSKEFKHTPGPWKVDPKRSIVLGTLAFWVYSESSGSNVAPASQDDIDDENEVMANAYLIAAAPEMLEALERAKQFIENGIELGYIQQPKKDSKEAQVAGIITGAIRKAKGEEQ